MRLSPTLILVAALSASAATARAQSQIVNARGETVQATRGLDGEVQAVAARGVPAWIAYRIAIHPGPQHVCSSGSFNSPRMLLEPPHELTVLIRVEDRRIVRIQTATPDCEIDAGGLPAVWLNGITPADSMRWLLAQITSNDTSTQRDNRIVQPALTALVWHDDDAAVRSVVGLARDDRRTRVRSQALFWLAQRAGSDALATIRNAINDDPETEVKKKAVFALSQLPKDQGIPQLIDVAKNHKNPEVRKQAMFWLGQSNDPRAIAFFEQVLTK